MNDSKRVLVTFSGGRDSSSVVVDMVKQGYFVTLYTYQAGMPELTGFLGDSAPDIRHKELLKAFPGRIDESRIVEGSLHLVRKLAIERTNETHVVYPIALALAFHCGAILYCLKHGIREIACGYSGYQAKEERYIEQSEEFFSLMKDFLGEYSITYHAPAINKTKQEVIDTLEMAGISSNSMENKSVFGGISFEVIKARAFWDISIPLCRHYITEMRKLHRI